jgi:hypothetical protein
MRLVRRLIALFVVTGWPSFAVGQTATEDLIASANPDVQRQIKKTYDTIHRLGVISYDNVEVFGEAQKVKELIAPQEDEDDEIVNLADEVEIMRQLAVFVATTESSENTHVIISWTIWRYLNVSPEATIRALAPYLDSSNGPLQDFARDFFQGHDGDEDYLDYVRWKVSRDEEIPAPLIKLLYERSPGQAMWVFQRGTVDTRAQLQSIQTSVEANQQDRELTPEEQEKINEVEAESKRRGREAREMLLAEHVISEALWLHKNGFIVRLRAALPEALAGLEVLAKHDKWWARLYVVYIMRQNHVLMQDHILRQLAEDENALVREAATARRGR